MTVTPVLPTGTQNYNGQSVFSVVPVEGLMFPGKAQEFTVTFSPDHESLYFSDLLQVVLFEKVKLIAGPTEISPHPWRDPCGSLVCPFSTAFIIWPFMLEAVSQRSASPVLQAPRLSQPQSSTIKLHGRLLCFLSPESLPPDPPEGRGPRAHDVCGGRRPTGCACGVPRSNHCL